MEFDLAILLYIGILIEACIIAVLIDMVLKLQKHVRQLRKYINAKIKKQSQCVATDIDEIKECVLEIEARM